jgi:hypothetical protein
VAARPCPACASPNPVGSAYCGTCGAPISTDRRRSFPVGRFSAFRFQVDPTDPPPIRDLRWLALVLGICSILVSVFLLAVYAIVGAAESGPGGCGTSSCGAGLFQALFLVPGLVLLAVGAIAVIAVLLDLR